MKIITLILIIISNNLISQHFNNNLNIVNFITYKGKIYYSLVNKDGISEFQTLEDITDTTTNTIFYTLASIKNITLNKNIIYLTVDSSYLESNLINGITKESIIIYRADVVQNVLYSDSSVYGFGIRTLVKKNLIVVGSEQMGFIYEKQKNELKLDTSLCYLKYLNERYLPLNLERKSILFYVEGPPLVSGLKLFELDDDVWKLKLKHSFYNYENINQFSYENNYFVYSSINKVFINSVNEKSVNELKRLTFDGYISALTIFKNQLYFAIRDSNNQNKLMRLNLKTFSVEKLFDVNIQSETIYSLINQIVVSKNYLFLITDNEKELNQPNKSFIRYIGKNLLVYKL
jgi:hypothetical protein